MQEYRNHLKIIMFVYNSLIFHLKVTFIKFNHFIHAKSKKKSSIKFGDISDQRKLLFAFRCEICNEKCLPFEVLFWHIVSQR